MSNLPFDVHPEGFLDLEPSEYPSYQEARSVIIPFGLEASVSYGKGTSKGPAAILAAGPQVELFDEVLWKEPHHDFQAVVLSEPVINPSLPLALDQLSGIVSRVLDDGKFPLVLGGEHAITAGSIRPFLQRYPDLAILHFDATRICGMDMMVSITATPPPCAGVWMRPM
jgi:agmatinase